MDPVQLQFPLQTEEPPPNLSPDVVARLVEAGALLVLRVEQTGREEDQADDE